MKEVLLQDFENLSLERLSRIKKVLGGPAESSTTTTIPATTGSRSRSATRLKSAAAASATSKPLSENNTNSKERKNDSAPLTRIELSRKVIEVSLKTLDGLKENSVNRLSRNRKHIYEASSAAIAALYDIKRSSGAANEYEAEKHHVSLILKILDLSMVRPHTWILYVIIYD